MPGILPTRSFSGPIFWIIRICSRKSSRVKLPSSIFIASSVAFFWSTTSSKSFIRPTTSPMPRTRLAIPSGRNSSSLSTPSPMPTKRTGAPVTSLHAERRAAARVAVELRHDDARETEPLVEALRDLDGVLSDHRIDDEQDVLGPDRRLDRRELLHELLVDREAPRGVVDDDVAFRAFASAIACVQISSGGRAGDVEDGEVDLLAEDLELLDGGGPLHVGGDEERLLPLLLQVARELRASSSSCRTPGARPS